MHGNNSTCSAFSKPSSANLSCLRFPLQETVQETRSQTTCGIYSLLLPQSSPSLVTTTNQLLLLSYLLVVVFLFLKLKALLLSFCPADQLRVVTSDAIIWPDKRLYIIIPFCHNTLQCTGRRRLVNHLTAIVVSGCQAVVKTCLLPLLVANKTELPFGTGIVHLTKFFFVSAKIKWLNGL